MQSLILLNRTFICYTLECILVKFNQQKWQKKIKKNTRHKAKQNENYTSNLKPIVVRKSGNENEGIKKVKKSIWIKLCVLKKEKIYKYFCFVWNNIWLCFLLCLVSFSFHFDNFELWGKNHESIVFLKK